MKAGKIPPEIEAAAKAAWGGKGKTGAGASALGRTGKTGAQPVGSHGMAQIKAAGAGGKTVKARNAEAEAEAFGWLSDSDLYARDVFGSDQDFMLESRDAKLGNPFSGHSNQPSNIYGQTLNGLYGASNVLGPILHQPPLQTRNAKWGSPKHKHRHSKGYRGSSSPLPSKQMQQQDQMQQAQPQIDQAQPSVEARDADADLDGFSYLFDREAGLYSEDGVEQVHARLDGPVTGDFQGSIHVRDPEAEAEALAEAELYEDFEIFTREAEAEAKAFPEAGFEYEELVGYY